MAYNSPGANIPVSNYYTQGMTAPPVGLLGPGDFPSVDTSGLLGFTPISIPDLTGGLSSSKFDVAASIEAQEAANNNNNNNGNRPEDEGTQWGGGSQPDGEDAFGDKFGALHPSNSRYAGTQMYGSKFGLLSHAEVAAKYGADSIITTQANKDALTNAVVAAMLNHGIVPSHPRGQYSSEDFANLQAEVNADRKEGNDPRRGASLFDKE